MPSAKPYAARTYVTLSQELQEQMKNLAEVKELSQAALIRQALIEYIQRNKAQAS